MIPRRCASVSRTGSGSDDSSSSISRSMCAWMDAVFDSVDVTRPTAPALIVAPLHFYEHSSVPARDRFDDRVQRASERAAPPSRFISGDSRAKNHPDVTTRHGRFGSGAFSGDTEA